MNPEVDRHIGALKAWRPEIKALREILLSCGLKEEFKWRQPCYTSKGMNIAIIGNFKDCCVVSFFKGAMLDDPDGILQKPGENTQAGRVIRFRNLDEIQSVAGRIRDLLHQAVDFEESGAMPEKKEPPALQPPAELIDAFERDPALRAAFEGLTSGRRRGYLMHFNAASQSDTRTRRIEKFKARIMNGKGIHDCVCGLSQRMPNCDGSHRYV
jgi:uncharacterized protein YdeI (YjbR/CyaY-like superfamily)